jgi:alkyl hydroperoxide reductase subunit AhpC
MALQIGQKAPEISLYNSDKNKVNLSDFAGKKVVLLFFPQAFSSICTTELCSVRDDIGNYEKVDAQILGISVDSVNSLNRFKQDQGYTFPLLSDFNKDVSRAYDAIYENWVLDMKGVSKRSAYVIDGEGIIQYAEVSESPADIPNFEAIKETLAKIG